MALVSFKLMPNWLTSKHILRSCHWLVIIMWVGGGRGNLGKDSYNEDETEEKNGREKLKGELKEKVQCHISRKMIQKKMIDNN